MNSWKRNTYTRSRMPIRNLSSGRQTFGRPRNSQISFFTNKKTIIATSIIILFLVIVAIGSREKTDLEEGTSLNSLVQESMVRSGLPTVTVRIIDSTVVLDGIVETEELKEAATRVAQAQPGVISVENMLRVPVPIEQSTTTTIVDLPATQADLLLQTRLSAAGAYPPIQFESGGDLITLGSVPTLERLAYFLANEPEIRVQILGHTDSDEKCPGDNLTLSQKRAEAVRTQLLAREVQAERLIATGMGHSDPIADNISKSGKAANRRIEFLLITDGQEGITPPSAEIENC